jgi:hypothetical protein
MNYDNAILIICLTLFIVVGVNAAIYVMVTRGKEVGQIELFRRAAHRARRPWGEEDDALQELSDRVKVFKREGENPDQQ